MPETNLNQYGKIPVIQHLNNWNTINRNFWPASQPNVRAGGGSLHAVAAATHHPALSLLRVRPLPHPPNSTWPLPTCPLPPPPHRSMSNRWASGNLHFLVTSTPHSPLVADNRDFMVLLF